MSGTPEITGYGECPLCQIDVRFYAFPDHLRMNHLGDHKAMDVVRELDAMRFTSTDADRAVMADLRERARLILEEKPGGVAPVEPQEPRP
jgi:hypothetical protein